jgi:uncharacterized protein (DUF305 family)
MDINQDKPPNRNIGTKPHRKRAPGPTIQPDPAFPVYFQGMRPLSLLLLAALATGCASSRSSSNGTFVMGAEGAIARARADSLRYPYTKADIDFMSGMIHHHAQAITISRWAPSHGADPAVQRLCLRIINAQSDEINLMQMWLRDRNQAPPTVDSTGKVTMPGMGGMAGHEGHDMGGHSMVMPGMLTDAQMKELDAARGKEFDRLFLTYMIAHHRGAVSMVKTLFSSPGAGQDETVFKFANDVEVDQSTEIKRMITMMLEFDFIPPPPPTE